jgi:predicted HicB family RNase H-like nuclease
MTPDFMHYDYHVRWSPEDQEFVGLVTEFPSLSWLDPDQMKAMEGIRAIVKSVVEDMAEAGEPIPIPLSERRFSGRFLVRTDPRTHARLSAEAAALGISLNSLINQKLVG